MKVLSRDDIRAAHMIYHKTRCGWWLIATGNRAVSVVQMSLSKGPVEVVRRAVPRPEFGCDIHPVEDE